MSNYERIVVLDDQFQAQLLHLELERRDIPHVIRSYHDSAYDGLYQLEQGYGCVEAPPEFAEEIRSILAAISEAPASETGRPEAQEPADD